MYVLYSLREKNTDIVSICKVNVECINVECINVECYALSISVIREGKGQPKSGEDIFKLYIVKMTENQSAQRDRNTQLREPSNTLEKKSRQNICTETS